MLLGTYVPRLQSEQIADRSAPNLTDDIQVELPETLLVQPLGEDV